MGQRHQIYVQLVLHETDYAGKRTTKKHTVGIHHQWLFGRTAVKQALRFLSFWREYQEAGTYFQEKSALQQLLTHVYSVIPEESYWHNVFGLKEEVRDPRLGDNNDGITVFKIVYTEDLRQRRDERSLSALKYAFLGIGASSGALEPPAFRPLSARQFLRSYYPKLRFTTCGEATPEVISDWETTVAALEGLGASLLTPAELGEMFRPMNDDLVKAAVPANPGLFVGATRDELLDAGRASIARSARPEFGDALAYLAMIVPDFEEAFTLAEDLWEGTQRATWTAKAS